MAKGKFVLGTEVNDVLKGEGSEDSIKRVFRKARQGASKNDATWSKVLAALQVKYPSQGRQSLDITADIDDALLDAILDA